MLSKQIALEDQEALHDLCAPRPFLTGEVFAPNDFYGNATVLKEYMGFSNSVKLKTVVPHGVALGPSAWQEELDSPLKYAYVWQKQRQGIFKANGKKVILGAAPIVYALANLKNAGEWQPERQGTLFFPAHSTEHVKAEYDAHAVAAYLKQIPDQYQPITICLYWKDIELRHIYESLEFKVVSAGNMYDPDFLYRLLHLMSCHKYAMSHEVGSHAFYSVVAGCQFYFTKDRIKYISDGVEPQEYVYAQRHTKKASDVRWIFRKDWNEVAHYVSALLQIDLMKSPKELSKDLL